MWRLLVYMTKNSNVGTSKRKILLTLPVMIDVGKRIIYTARAIKELNT